MQVRSHESLLDEAKMITQEKDFKGYIHDVGGPTANFRQPSCEKQLTRGVCKNCQCLFPKPCPNLKVDHRDYIKLLKELRDIPKVKKVFIRSGIRFDYVVADKSDAFLEELCRYHVSGQLKVAPEHVSDDVLTLMGKPENSVYQEFVKKYNKMNQKIHKDQYLVPYLMSSHPGSRMNNCGRTCRAYPGSWIYAGTGTGFLSDTVNDLDVYVLYRRGSKNDAAGLCAEESA